MLPPPLFISPLPLRFFQTALFLLWWTHTASRSTVHHPKRDTQTQSKSLLLDLLLSIRGEHRAISEIREGGRGDKMNSQRFPKRRSFQGPSSQNLEAFTSPASLTNCRVLLLPGEDPTLSKVTIHCLGIASSSGPALSLVRLLQHPWLFPWQCDLTQL